MIRGDEGLEPDPETVTTRSGVEFGAAAPKPLGMTEHLSIVLSQMTQAVGDLAANAAAMREVRARHGVAAVVGIDTYGESAPAPVLFKHFGFTPENVADTVRKVLAR